jgi:hypothetical protein
MLGASQFSIAEALQVSEQLAEQSPDDLDAQLCPEPCGLFNVWGWSKNGESPQNALKMMGKLW